MYREHDGGRAVIRLADNTTIPADEQNADWQGYLAWMEAGNVAEPEPAPALEDLKQAKLAQINAAYEAEFAAIKQQYPESERLSWPIQLRESEAFANDPQASTPFLDVLLIDRGFGETKAELAAKVQAKNLAYSTMSASLTGKRHKLERQVMDAETLEQVSGVIW